MYPANVYKVMIASPGDIKDERDIARQLILDWNNLYSRKEKIVLLPLLWEHNTTPSTGQRPQGHINDQMLKYADLLVGIFWTRIGSDTGVAISGTVEELERHIDEDKPAMLYFSKVPVTPGYDREQYEAVEKFKKDYQKKALFSVYGSVEEFREMFRNHLVMTVNNHFIGFSLDDKQVGIGNSIGTIPDFYSQASDAVNLSAEANQILKAAACSKDGLILETSSSQGYQIQIDGKQLIPNQEPRTTAKYKGAFEELMSHGFLISKGKLFAISESGFTFFDNYLKEESLSEPATRILLAASKIKSGRLQLHENNVGFYIMSGNTHLIPDQNIRTITNYKAAIEELVIKGYMKKGETGKSITITELGFKHLDNIPSR